MRIRCAGCHGEFWVDLETASASVVRVPCTACGADYNLHVPDDKTRFEARLATRALTLTRLQQIDLPSAYSILLGVMTLDAIPDLEAICSALSPETSTAAPEPSPPSPVSAPDLSTSTSPAGTVWVPPAPVAAASGSTKASRGVRFDAQFSDAVDAGHLTPMQAMQRGARARYVLMIMKRHGLPEPLAGEVADNRMSLLEALRHWDFETAERESPPPVLESSGPGWGTLALLAAVGISVGVAVFILLTRV